SWDATCVQRRENTRQRLLSRARVGTEKLAGRDLPSGHFLGASLEGFTLRSSSMLGGPSGAPAATLPLTELEGTSAGFSLPCDLGDSVEACGDGVLPRPYPSGRGRRGRRRSGPESAPWSS